MQIVSPRLHNASQSGVVSHHFDLPWQAAWFCVSHVYLYPLEHFCPTPHPTPAPQINFTKIATLKTECWASSHCQLNIHITIPEYSDKYLGGGGKYICDLGLIKYPFSKCTGSRWNEKQKVEKSVYHSCVLSRKSSIPRVGNIQCCRTNIRRLKMPMEHKIGKYHICTHLRQGRSYKNIWFW